MSMFSRRAVLAGAGGLVAAAAVGCSANTGGGDSGGSTTVKVTMANHVWTENVKKAIPEFEKASGLKIEITQLAEDQLSDQYNVKLNAGTSEIDVMMYRPLQEGRLFAQNKYFADLTSKAKADATWNLADFQAAPIAATTYQGKVVGVPIITEREVLYYRKDLLQKAGLSVPKTLDELEAAAKAIKAANPDVAGFVARTSKSPAFTQCKAAFYTEADSLYKNATDPAKSKVADTVGFAVFPAGPAGSKPYNIPSWALGINDASKNQANAWKFIQWATSKEQTLAQQKGGIPGARTSVWADADGTSSYPKDLAEAIAASTKGGVDHDRPIVAQVVKAREAGGQPIVDSIKGSDVTASVETAVNAFQAVLDTEKK